jgi:hypothetical protein
MSWPKYNSPGSKPGVIRRIYPGFLVIDEEVRSPQYTFQIARRSRIMGFTISGDVERMRIEFKDITGEQFTAGPTWIPNLIGGWTQNPLSNIFPGAYVTDQIQQGQHYHTPYIFEPNIVLAPNQTLTVNGSQIQDVAQGDDFRVDFCFHVYEFPGQPGSPL